jgi:hypothetical protein
MSTVGNDTRLKPTVAGQHLVSSFPTQTDPHMLAPLLAEEIKRNRRESGHRLVQMLNGLLNQLRGDKIDDDLVMLRVELPGDNPGIA